MLSSHVVSPTLLLSPDLIPDQSPEATVASFQCAICFKIGSEDCPDSTIYVDAQGRYMRGAQMSPGHGWACSAICLSRLMFRVASPEQKDQLRRLGSAIRAIEETAPRLNAMLEEWGFDVGSVIASLEAKVIA